MKIVFSFRGNSPQVSFGGHPYGSPNYAPTVWRGAEVEGILVDVYTKKDKTQTEGDALYLEGTLESLKMVFQDALGQLNDLEEIFKKQVEETTKYEKCCPKCQRYYDSRLKFGHGDGTGKACFPPEDE